MLFYPLEDIRSRLAAGVPPRPWTVEVGAPGLADVGAGAGQSYWPTVLSVMLMLVAVGLTVQAHRRSSELARMQTDFVSHVSHQLKTPLSLLVAATETLQMDRIRSPEKLVEYLDTIRAEAQRLSTLVQRVLEFSRVQQARTYEFERVDLGALVRETVDAFAHGLSSRQVDFDVRQQGPGPYVLGDPAALEQVVANLLDNAVKYLECRPAGNRNGRRGAPPGSGHGRRPRRRHRQGRPGPHLRAVLSRSWRLALPRLRSRPADRARDRSCPTRKGRSVERAQRRQHVSGDLALRGGTNRGDRTSWGGAGGGGLSLSSARVDEPRHVLVIEDEPQMRSMLVDNLEFEGYRVTAVASGEEALQRCASQQFALLLVDVMLPGMSGFEVCEQVRSRGMRVPIVVLTARTEEHDRVRGLDLGADDYVSKPFSVRELLARVRAQVRRDDWRSPSGEQFALGDVVVIPRQRLVLKKGKRIALSAREFELLRYLFAHRNEVVSREQLLRDVWGYHELSVTRTVDNYMAKLRTHIEPQPHAPQFIITVHGSGYQLLV